MSDEVKIDSDTGAASLLRLLMPAVHFHLRISNEHSLRPFPFLSVLLPSCRQGLENGSWIWDLETKREASIRDNPAGECDVGSFLSPPTHKSNWDFQKNTVGQEIEQHDVPSGLTRTISIPKICPASLQLYISFWYVFSVNTNRNSL